MGLLERGFKTWAERFAEGLRKEMGLGPMEPVNLEILASQFSAKLRVPSDIAGMTDTHLKQLLDIDPSGWSAITVVVGSRAVIVYNDRHSLGRQASDIAHEIAHLILEHEPSKLVLSQDGSMVMRSFNAKQEEEANSLAWTILLPRQALIIALKRGMSADEIASHFRVSLQLVQFRLRTTGAIIQTKRANAYR